jgi:hypothetical protein
LQPLPWLATKARAYKGAGQEGSMGITCHAPENVGECEGMDFHTPKWALTLGVWVPIDSQIFKEQLQGPKSIGLRNFLYHWKTLVKQMSEMGSHDSFRHLKHKLWPKERLRVKLRVCLSTTKSQKRLWFACVQVACNIGLQLYFRHHLNQRSTHKVMGPQNRGSPNFQNWESWDKMTLGVGHMAMHRVYYKREGDGFPQVRVVVSFMVYVCLWPFCAPKCSNYALINLLFGLCKFVWVIELIVNLLSPIQELKQSPLPWKCYELKSLP